MVNNVAKVLILGAGFSFNAGVPLASKFTEELLKTDHIKNNGPSVRHVKYLNKFVGDIFGDGTILHASKWPDLEDIFTIVDLSANSGHNLGENYSASQLRNVRRAILVRTIRMLRSAYTRSLAKSNPDRRRLNRFFVDLDTRDSAAISMNWDTVFEDEIIRMQKLEDFNYGCDAISSQFVDGVLSRRIVSGGVTTIIKPHGSINWLYCDACRRTFWVPPMQTEKVAQVIFRNIDWRLLSGKRYFRKSASSSSKCFCCGALSLGTRFATFSYRKALDFPMHSASWRTSEDLLQSAEDWIFFGYSMPSADYEFKHLLKRIQLTKKPRPTISLITGGADAGNTVDRFKRFFGDIDDGRIFKSGLDDSALKHLYDIGVLRRPLT